TLQFAPKTASSSRADPSNSYRILHFLQHRVGEHGNYRQSDNEWKDFPRIAGTQQDRCDQADHEQESDKSELDTQRKSHVVRTSYLVARMDHGCADTLASQWTCEESLPSLRRKKYALVFQRIARPNRRNALAPSEHA